MTSSYMKALLLKYWRFERAYYNCAVEVPSNSGQSDIVVDNGKEVVEIEVKISISDLKADFKKKKFRYFSHPYHKRKYWYFICNRFYYAIPEELCQEASKIISDMDNNFGIISVSKRTIKNKGIEIIKVAKKINETFPGCIRKTIMQRTSSDLVKGKMKEEGIEWKLI